MYYPYLRARQFELIALRDLALQGVLSGYIMPILEPVKRKNTNLNLAYKIFKETSQNAYLIMNPLVGETSGDSFHYLEYINQLDGVTFVPAFHYSNNKNYILQCIEDYSIGNCMIICLNDVSVNDAEFRELIQIPEITAITIENPTRNRSLNNFIKTLDKIYIRLDDLFEKKARNSDFLQTVEHRFTEEHLYYKDEDFDGFSDYTVLPSEFSDGGSTPRAVVIHITYLFDRDNVWIRHFTSITNDSIANIQGKFAEAAGKAVRFCSDRELSNSAIEELVKNFEEEHYPGLGTVKKIAMKNHLLVIQEYLKNN